MPPPGPPCERSRRLRRRGRLSGPCVTSRLVVGTRRAKEGARRAPLSRGEDFAVCGLPAASGIREGGACIGFFPAVSLRPSALCPAARPSRPR